MATTCLQCGDVGFDAYVYCVKCVKFAVHRYCLPEMPKTCDEIVRWVCDDCEKVSSWSVGQKVVLTTQDGRSMERVISTSTSYSLEKSISQSSQGGEESCGRTGPILQSVQRNLVFSGDARSANDCCLSVGERNANNDLSQKENIPMEHEHQSNTSWQLDGVEEVKLAVAESLQRTRLIKTTEPSSSLSGEKKQRLTTTSDQKKLHGEHQSDTSSRHSGEEEAEVVADESLQRTRLRKTTEVCSSVSAEEKHRLTTTSDQKRLHGEHQSDTSSRHSGEEEAEVVADESLERTRLGKTTEFFSSVSAEEKQRRPTISDQKGFIGEPQSDTPRLSGEEEAERKHEHQSDTSWQLDEVEEVGVVADESLQRTRVRKRTEVSSSLSGKEKQRLPTTSYGKTFDGEHQSDTCQHSEEEEADVAANKLAKRRKLRENSDISSAVPEEEKQKQTTSNDCLIPSKDKVDDAAPSRISPMVNEGHSSDLARICAVEEGTEVVADGSSQRTNLEVKRHISTSVTRKEKQMRWSTSPSQFRSRKRKPFHDRSLRYSPSRYEPRKHRSRSLDNIAKQRYSGPSSKDTPNSRGPMHNTVRERGKRHEKEESLDIPASKQSHEAKRHMHRTIHEFIPTQINVKENVSRQTHEARKPMHETVRERHRERVKEKSLVSPTRSNGNEDFSRLIHEARRPMHDTACEEVKGQVKEESLVIPTDSNVHKEVFRQPREARKLMRNTVQDRCKERMKEGSSVIPTHSNVHKEVLRQPHEARKAMGNTVHERYKECVRSNGDGEDYCHPIITQPMQVQPVIDPIWRGRFNIINKKDDMSDVFVAHLSNRACPKVITEARLLPALLHLEMVPKSKVWPKSFHTIQPSDDNIALYIFPAERRYEKVFDRLVNDMSDKELAMRAITKNAELLIFPSTELPMKYWRFQNKYFIWGVFRGKKSTSADTLEDHAKANLGQDVNRVARY